jgi:hypothetical protein
MRPNDLFDPEVDRKGVSDLQTPVKPDNNRAFLMALARVLGPKEVLWSTSFASDPSDNKQNGRWQGRATTYANGAIPEAQGTNNYFSVAILKPDLNGEVHRRSKNMSRMFLVGLDDIGDKADMPPLPLTYLLRTSPNSCQGAYLLQTPITDPKVAKRLLSEMKAIKRVTDVSGVNEVRYMRLPYGSNTKKVYGTPYQQVLEHWRPDLAYSLEEICDSLGVDFEYVISGERSYNTTAKNSSRLAGPNISRMPLEVHLVNEPQRPIPDKPLDVCAITPTTENVSIINDMLSVVPPDHGAPGGTRDRWRNIVWSVCSLGWGSLGESIARNWSQRGALFEQHTFDQTWNSYDCHREDKITIGTLIRLAKVAGYKGAMPNQGSLLDNSLPVSSPDCPQWLAEMNAHYAWIERCGGIYRLDYGDFIDPATFKFQHDNRLIEVETEKGSRYIGKGTAWIKHPKRREHRDVVMRPSEKEVTADGCINSWRGFSYPSTEGNVTPWLDLLERLFPFEDERTYVVQWLAHLVQHPGVKMYTALTIWSRQQGVGKNLLFDVVVEMIGERHAAVISQAALNDPFNAWTADRILILADEALGSGSRKDADMLKGLITSTKIRINEKFKPAREINNTCNFVFLSNHSDAVFLDERDRRYFVCDVKADRLPDALARDYVQWRDSGGIASLRAWLERFDLSTFDPKRPAPTTAAKEEMVEDVKSEVERFLTDLLDSNVAEILGREIIRAEELCELYSNRTMGQRPSAKAVTQICKRLGAVALRISLKGGRKVRLLALGRPNFWSKQDHEIWAEEFSKPFRYSADVK